MDIQELINGDVVRVDSYLEGCYDSYKSDNGSVTLSTTAVTTVALTQYLPVMRVRKCRLQTLLLLLNIPLVFGCWLAGILILHCYCCDYNEH